MSEYAMQRTSIDWDTIKLRYEAFGESPRRLGVLFNVDPSFIVQLAEEEGWAPLAELSETKLNKYVVGLFGATQSKIHLMAIYRELSIQPQFATFEETVIHKLQQTANNIDPFSAQAPTQLRSLLAAYETLAARHSRISNTLVAAMERAQGSKKPVQMTVTFTNKAVDDE